MSVGTVFVINGMQTVSLPSDIRLSEGVRTVLIRANGKERIISPIEHTWDSFFLGGHKVSEDFLPDRTEQHQRERDAL